MDPKAERLAVCEVHLRVAIVSVVQHAKNALRSRHQPRSTTHIGTMSKNKDKGTPKSCHPKWIVRMSLTSME